MRQAIQTLFRRAQTSSTRCAGWCKTCSLATRSSGTIGNRTKRKSYKNSDGSSSSGHGNTAEDESGDEQGGEDDTICPADFQKAGDIIDDDLNLMLAMKIPPGINEKQKEQTQSVVT